MTLKNKSGVFRIAAERKRQVAVENWTPKHDDEHTGGELAMAAAVYAMTPEERANEILRQNFAELLWPWEWPWFKPAKRKTVKGRIRELEKAGALIAAEIDRLLRVQNGSGCQNCDGSGEDETGAACHVCG